MKLQFQLIQNRWSRAAFLIFFTSFQICWMVWFLTAPLPNATPSGSADTISRGLLMLSTTPGINPGFRWSQSLLGSAFEELSHLSRLWDRIPVLACAVLILTAIWGLGEWFWLFLGPDSEDHDKSLLEEFFWKLAVGTAMWGSLTLILGRIGLLQRPFWVLLVIFLIGSGLFLSRKTPFRVRVDLFGKVFRLIPWPTLPFLLIMMLASMQPTIDFDCIEYHLQGPKEYWKSGQIGYLPHNIYTNMPFGVEMLHTSAMSLSGDWQTGALTGQLLIALHGLLAAALIQLICIRWGMPEAGWWSALIYLSIPWTYRLAAIPYVEGPLCAATVGWIWASDKAIRERSFRAWVLVGLFSGWAMSCKYTAILPVIVPCAVVLSVLTIRTRSLSPTLGVILGGTLVFGPWLVKNVIDTGNPVYPLAWNLFGGRDWDSSMNAKWSVAHGRKLLELRLLWESLVDVAGRSDWQSPLLVAFLPASLFVIRQNRLKLICLWGLSAWIFLSWWLFTHRLDRFWLPIQPVLAILSGFGISVVIKQRLLSVWCRVLIAFSLSINWIYSSTALAGLNEWTQPLTELWKTVPNRLYPASVLVDQSLRDDDKVLLVGQAAVFYWQHEILYNTVFNRERIELIAKGRSSAEVHAILKKQRVTHVFVDWSEIRRYRLPGNYGFTDFVTEPLFDQFVRDGVLENPTYPGPQKTLYAVRP